MVDGGDGGGWRRRCRDGAGTEAPAVEGSDSGGWRWKEAWRTEATVADGGGGAGMEPARWLQRRTEATAADGGGGRRSWRTEATVSDGGGDAGMEPAAKPGR